MSVSRFFEKHYHQTPGQPEQKSSETPTQKTHTFTPKQDPVIQDTTTQKDVFHIFTDGACTNNGTKAAKGGFGVHFYSSPDRSLDIAEALLASEPQTNNRGELKAIQAALDFVDTNKEELYSKFNTITVWSDSEYSINCLTKWLPKWRKSGWVKSDGGEIQNLDLIRSISDQLQRNPKVMLQHVRAHQVGKEHLFPWSGNHIADELARQGVNKPKRFQSSQ